MREVKLHFKGAALKQFETVRIPQDMPQPDLITYKRHTFIRRSEALYEEASIWPIIDGLDGAA